MGLDLVEYVVAVEKTFELRFRDEDIERTCTVGEFHDLVMRELRANGAAATSETASVVCKTSRAFYRLRRGLISSGIATRKEIVPSATLESLFPRKDRRTLWSWFSIDSGCALPRLSRPAWLISAMVAVCLSVPLLAMCLLGVGIVFDVGVLIALAVCAIGVYVVLLIATQELATAFSLSGATVGDLARYAAGKNWKSRSEPDGPARRWTEEEAWNKISELLVECQGVDPKEITRDASFVDDLRMD
jgi:acyl carrier protein